MFEMIAQVFVQLAAGLLLRFRGSKPTTRFEAVSDFDLDRFLGTWFLAAYIPQPFQKKLNDASTTYTRKDDGSLQVINRHFNAKKGEWVQEETTGRMKAGDDLGWLIVETKKPFDENRKIIFLNEDYTVAIVTGLTMRTLWLAYRDPHIEKKTLDELIGQAADLGFKDKKLVQVDQRHSDDAVG